MIHLFSFLPNAISLRTFILHFKAISSIISVYEDVEHVYNVKYKEEKISNHIIVYSISIQQYKSQNMT